MNVSCRMKCLLKSIDILKYLMSFNFVRLSKNKEAVHFELRTTFKLGLNIIQKFKGLRQSFRLKEKCMSLSDKCEQCTHSTLSAVKCVKHAQEISKQIEEIEFMLLLNFIRYILMKMSLILESFTA